MAAALAYVEKHLLYSREGARGVRQVDVDGLVGAAFTHRDSRAGDPDLHTHVAVANKVRATGSGKWLSIDARLLYQGTVAASETYNTAIYKGLEAMGLAFEDRAMGDGKRPVREVVGVPDELNKRWSSRRRVIEHRRGELATQFQDDHGRPPTTVEGYALAQQATLETREAKHEPRTIGEQRAVWHAEATAVLGGEVAIQQVVQGALNPGTPSAPVADSDWFARAAVRVVETLEQRSATWRETDARAEAQRQVRRTATPTAQVDSAVALLTSMALDRSIALPRPDGGITEPAELTRTDGSSVYTVAGSLLYTSRSVLAAEAELLDLAGQTGAAAVPGHVLDQSLKASEDERGFPLNPGQTALVHDLATSGRRLQLAIAPAGSGKTTAMHALAAAWEATGHSVIGLAPSAAAAAQLAEATRVQADTMAKLAWGIRNAQLPDWADQVTEDSLVIIDEAGMADTLSLAQVTRWATDRGAVVRLVGDDQQLAAIGAGGLLRDIQNQHGAASLSELIRFTDPAEAAASLALRQGDASALGFYLDNDRVHVGDLATVVDNAFDAWVSDRAAGRDAIMLAPTRDLVSELNQRARTHRLAGADPDRVITLADGNDASVGDVIITRRNHRGLRTSRTDWVKNGDRWTITDLAADGGVTAQHHGSQRLVHLPADYVRSSVELGYASTVHAAQGLSAEVMHGIVTGDLTRQQLYTMMTRGKASNHLWLQTVGDGDPALLNQPEGINPPTATDILEQVLAHDGAARSATTHAAEQTSPAVQLGHATAGYVDGVYAAAELQFGRLRLDELDGYADQLQPGLTECPAWPALKAHLVMAAANGSDPFTALRQAHQTRALDDARDPAATLAWRLHDTTSLTGGPLPWAPAIPTGLAQHPVFGPRLDQRAQLVSSLAQTVRETADRTAPWLPAGCSAQLAADIAVWRAAQQIPDTDLRPAGPRPTTPAELTHHRQLIDALGIHDDALSRWRPVLEAIGDRLLHDPAVVPLAHRLDGLAADGVDVHGLVAESITDRSLPDDHAAAALFWRLESVAKDAPVAPVERRSETLDVPMPDDPAARLALLGMIRQTQPELPLTDAELRHQGERADMLANSPVLRDRLVQINQMTQDYYTRVFPTSWARDYLIQRLGVDLTGHPTAQPGYAPSGWNHLVNHLRRHGVTDQEMEVAGVAKTASNGRVIDRFRDRLVLPITDEGGDILGFVGRANPTLPPDQAGPKYLNTPTTPLFCKGDQFYGQLRNGSTPVIVEGPLDALAVTLATGVRYSGLAPMGTSLTTEQARLLQNAKTVVIATDADAAGEKAAIRDHFQLAVHAVETKRALFPEGKDPAEVLIEHGPAALERTLREAPEQVRIVLESLPVDTPLDIVAQLAASGSPDRWNVYASVVADRFEQSLDVVAQAMHDAAEKWADDPGCAGATATPLAQTLANGGPGQGYESSVPSSPAPLPRPQLGTDPVSRASTLLKVTRPSAPSDPNTCGR